MDSGLGLPSPHRSADGKVRCSCGEVAEYVMGAVVFPRNPEYRHNTYHYCQMCDAWAKALDRNTADGPLASHALRAERRKVAKELRALCDAKIDAGADGREAYSAGLAWLLSNLDRGPADTWHFDMPTCKKARELMKPHLAKIKKIRARREKAA